MRRFRIASSVSGCPIRKNNMRRTAREKRKRKSWTRGPIFKFVLPIIIIAGIFLLVKITTRYWNGHDKFAFVFRQEGGDVGVTVFDPKLEEETTLIIPGDTEVDVAQSYGTLRIKNVWQLGLNEKIGGKLLAATVAKNFLFPVFLWSDEDGASFVRGNTPGIFRFMFFPEKTNISLGDRVSVALFALKVRSLNRTEIDLGKSQFLRKERLNDGAPGYRLTGPVSGRLSIYFSDNDLTEANLKVFITDSTGKFGVAEKVGEIVEVMGGKVVSIDKRSEMSGIDCEVSGTNVKIVRKIANLFSCAIRKSDGGLDLVIKLGTGFAERF